MGAQTRRGDRIGRLAAEGACDLSSGDDTASVLVRLPVAHLAALGLAICAALLATPVAAMGPAPLDTAAASRIVEAQFRLPWESQRKNTRKTKRSPRGERSRTQKPPVARRDKVKTPTAKPAQGAAVAPGAGAIGAAAALDPLDAALPPALGPLDVAPPRGASPREANAWAKVAAMVPGPPPPPPPSPDGPAPLSVATIAALGPMNRARAAAEARTTAAAPEPDEPETPDIHVPLPPERPPSPAEIATAEAPRDGLSPERRLGPGTGLSPNGGLEPEIGVAPEGVPTPPTPPTRPGDVARLEPGETLKPEPPPGPSPPDMVLPVTTHDEDPDCGTLADPGFAQAARLPPIEGPGACGGGPLVLLTAVTRKDGGTIKVKPAATLRCSMAKALADFLRHDLAPAAKTAGAELDQLDVAGSFQCRGRNGANAGKMSEHGRANAVDLSGFGLSDGRTFRIFAADLPESLKTAAKSGACQRFDTVLGPGSDGFHETHLHIDLQPRRAKSKLCQWSDPEVARAPATDKQDVEAPHAGGSKAVNQGAKTKAAARKSDPQDDPPLPPRKQTP